MSGNVPRSLQRHVPRSVRTCSQTRCTKRVVLIMGMIYIYIYIGRRDRNICLMDRNIGQRDNVDCLRDTRVGPSDRLNSFIEREVLV